MNIFHLRKIFQRLFCGGSEVKLWFGREVNTWVKAKDAQVFKSKLKDSETPSFKNFQMKYQANKKGQKPGCHSL